MGLSRIERETIIVFNEEEDMATVSTSSSIWMRKMDKLCAGHPENFECYEANKMDGEVTEKRYRLPKKLVSIRSGTVHRELTEEQRQAFTERMKASRNSQD